MQAAAAILGGTQSLHTNSKDEAISLPTEDSARLALRTQQILAYESGLPDVADPLAGTYFVEDLTSKIETETLKLIDKIDSRGGAIQAIEESFQQNEIANASFDYQQSIETKEKIVVGVNKFQDATPQKNEGLFSADNKSVSGQIKRLKKFKSNRSAADVRSALKKLSTALDSNQNLIPQIILCIKNNCTLGEVCSVLKSKYGTY